MEQNPVQCCNKDDAGEKFRAQGANECKHSKTVEITIIINGRRGDLSDHQFQLAHVCSKRRLVDVERESCTGNVPVTH
jgi:hypothetical protein